MFDVAFSEDDCEIVSENEHKTLNIFRKLTLLIHRQHLKNLPKKCSVKSSISSAFRCCGLGVDSANTRQLFLRLLYVMDCHRITYCLLSVLFFRQKILCNLPLFREAWIAPNSQNIGLVTPVLSALVSRSTDSSRRFFLF